MKKYAVVLVGVVLFIFASLVSVFANDIVWDDIGRENLNLKTVLINPDNTKIIYVGSSNAVLKSEDGGVSWRNILSVRGQNKAVNFLSFDVQNKNSLYAATGNGLYYSSDAGKNWQGVFQGKYSLEKDCRVVASLPYGVYLGTKAGLFISKDKGRSWHKEIGKIGKSHILAIAYSLKEPNYIYIACVNGVFRTQGGGNSWEKTFVFSATENGNETEEINEDQDEAEQNSCIRYISIDPNNLDCVYLATSKGVYQSQDKGKTWQRLSNYGLFNRDTKFLKVSDKSRIYAVTESRIFEYRNQRWQELSFGLITEEIRSLELDNQGNLYAACNNGLFKARMDNLSSKQEDNIIALYYKNEPEIKDVQEAAIRYAEVGADKIKEWRKRAKMKAILPKLTVGLDNSKSTNYEIYTSATTRYVYDGPDDRSSGWDVTLSWELSDLIWSEAQTSIDVRSRLMVQLRDDILDEVTKLYFERLRMKIELENLSIEDRKKRLEKELRLEELTASLDALTGGYFSQQIKNKI